MLPERMLLTIVAHQKDELSNVDITSEELMNRGRTNEEIETAIKLACCIAYFDSQLFEKPINIAFAPERCKDKLFNFYAGYGHSPDKTEEYVVYVKDLPEKIKEDKRYFVSFDKKGKSFLTTQTEEEFIIKMGAHEVRHRLQNNNRVRIFYRDKKYKNPIGNFVKFTRLVYKYEAEEKNSKYIKERLSDHEFDANVMENFFANKLRKKKSLRELIETIKIEG